MTGRSAPRRRRTIVAIARLLVPLVVAGGCLQAAWAARNFPQNSRQVKISRVADDSIVADGDALHLAPGVVIFTGDNSTLVRSALPAGVIVRVQQDLNGDVRRIWLLNDDEILVKPWWQFWKTGQP